MDCVLSAMAGLKPKQLNALHSASLFAENKGLEHLKALDLNSKYTPQYESQRETEQKDSCYDTGIFDHGDSLETE